MSTKDKTQQELQSEFDDLKKNYQSLNQNYETLNRDHEALKRDYGSLKQQGFEQKTKQKHSAKFWEEIYEKCAKNDTQHIKSLIDNKTLSVNDVDDTGWSLLHIAA
eukprot:836716_1